MVMKETASSFQSFWATHRGDQVQEEAVQRDAAQEDAEREEGGEQPRQRDGEGPAQQHDDDGEGAAPAHSPVPFFWEL